MNIAKIKINGEQYNIRANMGALSEIQAAFKIKSIDKIGTVFDGAIDINNLITFMEILLRAGGNENSKELAKECEMSALTEAFEHLTAAMGGKKKPPEVRQKKASRSPGKKR